MSEQINQPKRRRFLWRLGFLVVLGVLIACTMPQTEAGWYRKNANRLSKMKITPEMISNAPDWRENGTEWSYLLSKAEGVIPIGKDGGVYVVCHSFHDNEFRAVLFLPGYLLCRALLGGPVADATLAVDQQGRLYRNEAHICGGLCLTSKKEVETIEDFLHTYADRSAWQPYAR